MAHTVDPIKAEVVARHLIATSEEMSATLMRTAFSPNIKERADCSSAVFDVQGQVIAGPACAGDLGSMSALLMPFPHATVWRRSPGRHVAMTNPTMAVAQHLPDITLLLQCSVRAHVAYWPTSPTMLTSVVWCRLGGGCLQDDFPEGLASASRIMHQESQRDVLDMSCSIHALHRTPWRDLQAQSRPTSSACRALPPCANAMAGGTTTHMGPIWILLKRFEPPLLS